MPGALDKDQVIAESHRRQHPIGKDFEGEDIFAGSIVGSARQAHKNNITTDRETSFSTGP